MEVKNKNFNIVTAYNSLNISQRQGCLELRSGGAALQSLIDLENPQRLALKNLEQLMGILLFVDEPESVLMLGTAAGSLIHFLRHYYPRTEICSVDIDVELVEKMQQMQILPRADERLSYVYDDAAHFIEHCGHKYDLLLVDVFDGAQSPAWLLQKRTTESLFRLLNPNGALGYNLLIASEFDFRNFYRDLRQVFNRQTLCLPVQGFENTIAYAVRASLEPLDMNGYLQRALRLRERNGIDYTQILSVIYNTNPVGQGLI